MLLTRYSGDLSTVDFIDLLILDIGGSPRSLSLPRAYMSESRMEDGIGVDAATFGYSDDSGARLAAVPDLSTAFVEEKEGARILRVLCDLRDEVGRDFPQYPRAVTRASVAELRASGIADEAMMHAELEFFAFDKVRYATGMGKSYYFVESSEGIGEGRDDQPRFLPSMGSLKSGPGDHLDSLRTKAVAAIEAAGIAVKYHHHETAAAQLEIELDFAAMPAAADAIVLAKWIIKSCADELGLHVTFMPKPILGLPGSGLHVHQYLANGGSTLFPGDGYSGLSPLALSYAAGLLEHSLTGSLLAWACPSTNSYRRLAAGSGAPSVASLAASSRSAAIRVPGYSRRGQERLEYRAGDATGNAYFFLSAMLLAGLDGARRSLDPVTLGYAAETSREGRQPEPKRLPVDLDHALGGLESDSAYLASAFPPSLVDSWIAAKKKEAAYVLAAPVPQEYELYF